jgi:hypothetical protein
LRAPATTCGFGYRNVGFGEKCAAMIQAAVTARAA